MDSFCSELELMVGSLDLDDDNSGPIERPEAYTFSNCLLFSSEGFCSIQLVNYLESKRNLYTWCGRNVTTQ
jgi:hypothetical protein